MNIRLQSEDDMRQWFGTQLQVVKQSQQMENGAALDREKQMMIQLNQGLASISEIVKQVKAQSSSQLKEMAQNSMDGINESVNHVSSISEGIKSKQAILEGTLSDLVMKMDTLQEQSIKHARLTNDTVAREITRVEKVMSTLEQFSKMQISDLRKEITTVKQDLDRWSVSYEDMQARKIMEIHQAIKTLNSNSAFIQKDTIERIELLQGSQANNNSMLHTQIKDMKQYLKQAD